MTPKSLPHRVLRWTLLGVGVAILTISVVVIGSIAYFDHTVTSEFKQRLWSVPAKIYAAPVELYADAPLSAEDVELELKRLHYRSQLPLKPGYYHRQGNRIDLFARQIQFVDGVRQAQRVTIDANGERVESISADGQSIPVFRLDPMLVGSVFPAHGEDRIVLRPDEIPPLLATVLKGVEDRRFDEHHGVDPKSILRAMWANLRAHHIVQGGSTLTQQLIKNYFLTDTQTFGRKWKEAIMAICLESHYSKEDILVAYINEITLGQDGPRAIHGFGLGAEFYFGKPVSELQLHEIALLVSVVRGPSFYDPFRHPDRARARRDLVLKELAEQGLIPHADAERAALEPLGVRSHGGGYVPAFLDLVRRDLKRDYPTIDLASEGLQVFTTLDPRAQASAEKALSKGLERLDAARHAPESLQGAVVVCDPQSGEVLAIVGGRDVGREGFDRALDARRPIGSLAKPAVYLSALLSGRYNAASHIEDAPIEVPLESGDVWRPKNFTREQFGDVTLVHALAESMNMATVRLGMEVGLPAIADTFEKLGVSPRPALVPSIILGTVELTPLEVANVYSTLANGGYQVKLHSVQGLVGQDGKLIKRFKGELTPAFPPEAVYALNRMLMTVTTRGTGHALQTRFPHLALAGKTGTSSDTRDSWFAGFSGSHVIVTWVGYDDNRVTGLTGALGALPIWADTLSGVRSESFSPVATEGVEERWVEFSTGQITTPQCSSDAVRVVVPADANLPVKASCPQAANLLISE